MLKLMVRVILLMWVLKIISKNKILILLIKYSNSHNLIKNNAGKVLKRYCKGILLKINNE